MRFQFSAPSADGGLSIIPLIPDFRLCQIEGRNGVGKTLATRLLEFLTGATPFAALPHAWDSLVESLGALTVIVRELPGGHELVFAVDSNDWRGRSRADCAANPGGTVTLDGRAIDWAEARRILRVRRIAGDEGLTETLGRTLREHAVDAETGAEYLGAVTREWSGTLGGLADFVSVVEAQSLREMRDLVAVLGNQTGKLRKDLADTMNKESATTRAVHAAERLDRLVREFPTALADYSAQFALLEGALTRVKNLEERAGFRARTAAADASRRHDLEKWNHKLDLRRRAAARAEFDLQQCLRNLGLQEVPADDEIARLRRDVASLLQDARNRSQTLDRAGTIRAVTQELERPLQRLPEQVLFETFVAGPARLSGVELRTGLGRRREELEGMPEPDEKAQVTREIRALERRNSLLLALPEYARSLHRKLANLDEARASIDRLSRLAKDSVAAQASRSELDVAREELGRRTLPAAQTLLNVRSLLEMGEDADAPSPVPPAGLTDDDEVEEAMPDALPAPEVLAEQCAVKKQVLSAELHDFDAGVVDDLLTGEAGSGSDGVVRLLHNRAESLTRERETLSAALEALSERQRVSHELLSGARAELRATVAQLALPAGEWAMFRDGIDDVCALHGTRLAELAAQLSSVAGVEGHVEELAAEVLAGVAQLATLMIESAARARDGWGTVAAYLNGAASELAPRVAEASAAGNVASIRGKKRLRSWAEGALSELLSAEELRIELFDSAQAVSVDLDRQAVLWRTPSGQRMRRPFEAFSSGEQVFAYTRAKLEQFAPLRQDGTALVIVLDEFGAFVARDRFSQLMSYVENEALGRIADQIVVMLPFSGMVADSFGALTDSSSRSFASVDDGATPGYVAFAASVR